MASEAAPLEVTQRYNTVAATAALRALIALAAQARAAMAGLPPVGVVPSASPRLPAMKSGDIPGGARPTFTVPARTTSTSATYHQGYSPVMRGDKAAVPGGPGQARTAGQASSAASAPPARSMAPPIIGPGHGASQSALAQHQSRLGRQVERGFRTRGATTSLGPLAVTGSGINLTSGLMRVAGPAAAYAALIYVGAKTTERFIFDPAIEAGERSRANGTSFAREFLTSASNAASDTAVGAGRKLAGGVTSVVEGVLTYAKKGTAASRELGPLLPAAWLIGKIDSEFEQRVDAAISNMREWVNVNLMGERSAAQRRGDASRVLDDDLAAAVNRARDMAARDAEKAADQLLGRGFPGTKGTLRDIARVPYEELHRAREVGEVEERWRRRNGVRD